VKSVKTLEEVCGGNDARGSSLKRKEEKMKKMKRCAALRLPG
jgi:hypothetical protein